VTGRASFRFRVCSSTSPRYRSPSPLAIQPSSRGPWICRGGRSTRTTGKHRRLRPKREGGAIYLASGTLSLFNDTISNNDARGGKRGQGGAGGGQGTKSAPGVTGGKGGTGGNGGSAAGGALYAAGGTVLIANDTFGSNQAVGGPGGSGGSGGSGGRGKPLATPPVPGKPGGTGGAGGLGGSASGGAIYLAAGILTMSASTLQANSAAGGAGGKGGTGGPGTAAVGGSTNIFGGRGSFPGLNGLSGLVGQGGPGGGRRTWWHGRSGGGRGRLRRGRLPHRPERDSHGEPGRRRSGWNWRTRWNCWFRRLRIGSSHR